MSGAGNDIIIGVDAGTSVIKSIAFDTKGNQLATASTPNRYTLRGDGAAVQPLDQTWQDCAHTLRELGQKVEGLAGRTAAIAVTGQGDGTWLVGRDNEPVGEAWLWLDARAATLAKQLSDTDADADRYRSTGTGLAACQQGPQMALMDAFTPEMLDQAEAALHCKDWLYLNFTNVRATDPSEANFTFGDYRTRQYNDQVVSALGLTHRRHLLPNILDGTQQTHPLTDHAAQQTGLRSGTPVCLGYVDVVCTGLGGGVVDAGQPVGCSIVGSTGMHMKASSVSEVTLNEDRTGYVMMLPLPDMAVQMQSNMAGTLNTDWVLSLAQDLLGEFGQTVSTEDLIDRIEGWLRASQPGRLVYHPYISESGERGPFINAAARASFNGLSTQIRFNDMVRATIEGLGMAARDCYTAMGSAPAEVRLSGGAARSDTLRAIHAAALNSSVRTSVREEAGAAGAAMMAAVSIGCYETMESCIDEWVSPYLGEIEAPDAALVQTYDRVFQAYRKTRLAMEPVWDALPHGLENGNG